MATPQENGWNFEISSGRLVLPCCFHWSKCKPTYNIGTYILYELLYTLTCTVYIYMHAHTCIYIDSDYSVCVHPCEHVFACNVYNIVVYNIKLLVVH